MLPAGARIEVPQHMKQLASYSFDAPSTSGMRACAALDLTDKWLHSKGTLSAEGRSLHLRDGRIAEVARAEVKSSIGCLTEVVVTEPRPDGWFRTTIRVGESEEAVAMSIGLSAASTTLAPVYVDVRCPRLVRDVLAPPSPWRYQGTPVAAAPVEYTRESGGDEFVALAWDPARSVPIVAVSDEYGSVLHPGIVGLLAADLSGLAIVARLDPQASWRVTRRKGKEWSCYSGAIRLFWPGLAVDDSPYRYPLWTPSRLLASVPDTEAAAERIRRELRRRILGQSAFAVADPPLFVKIRQAAREEELAALRARTTSDAGYKAFAEEYFEALAKANETISERDTEIEELQGKLRGLQYALQSKRGEPEELAPDTETPPATVEDAVLIAMDEMKEELIFGSSITEGVKSLAQDAGPPEKILRYLRVLGEFTRARRDGTLGKGTIKWLQERGVTASAESETVRKSREEQQARTWDYGNGERKTFDMHLKPSDATAPDRCVRMYFEYDETRQVTVVAWVGRHP